MDLGYVVDDPELGTRFALGLTIVPESRIDLLPAGDYRLRLALVCANADARYYELRLYYRGAWMADLPTQDLPEITDGPRLVAASS